MKLFYVWAKPGEHIDMLSGTDNAEQVRAHPDNVGHVIVGHIEASSYDEAKQIFDVLRWLKPDVLHLLGAYTVRLRRRA